MSNIACLNNRYLCEIEFLQKKAKCLEEQVCSLRVRKACAEKAVEDERNAAASQIQGYLEKIEKLRTYLLCNLPSSSEAADISNESRKLAEEMEAFSQSLSAEARLLSSCPRPACCPTGCCTATYICTACRQSQCSTNSDSCKPCLPCPPPCKPCIPPSCLPSHCKPCFSCSPIPCPSPVKPCPIVCPPPCPPARTKSNCCPPLCPSPCPPICKPRTTVCPPSCPSPSPSPCPPVVFKPSCCPSVCPPPCPCPCPSPSPCPPPYKSCLTLSPSLCPPPVVKPVSCPSPCPPSCPTPCKSVFCPPQCPFPCPPRCKQAVSYPSLCPPPCDPCRSTPSCCKPGRLPISWIVRCGPCGPCMPPSSLCVGPCKPCDPCRPASSVCVPCGPFKSQCPPCRPCPDPCSPPSCSSTGPVCLGIAPTKNFVSVIPNNLGRRTSCVNVLCQKLYNCTQKIYDCCASGVDFCSSSFVRICEVHQTGKYIKLMNTSVLKAEDLGAHYIVQQQIGGWPLSLFKFPERVCFPAQSTIKIWTSCSDPGLYKPPTDFVFKQLLRWSTGPSICTFLCRPDGQLKWVDVGHLNSNSMDEMRLQSMFCRVELFVHILQLFIQFRRTVYTVRRNESTAETI